MTEAETAYEVLDANDLAYWYPKLKATGVLTPRTVILQTEADFWPLFDDLPSKSAEEFFQKVREAALAFGLPLFLRTGHLSGKHSWKKTCYLENIDDLGSHLMELLSESAMAMPSMPWSTWVLRQFLDLDVRFKAFYGEMPISVEQRFFIKGGRVICHHPYWPPQAFEGLQRGPDGWRKKLEEMNDIRPDELLSLKTKSERVSFAFDDAWSLDWARTRDGAWYALDMALARVSWHWPGCTSELARG